MEAFNSGADLHRVTASQVFNASLDQVTKEQRDFAKRLGNRVQIPVDLYDERFTTSIAAARGGSGSEDSRAAAVLLEDYLARHPV